MNHHDSTSGPNESVPPNELKVKELIGGTHARRKFQMQLQGLALHALEQRCKKLNLRHSDYVRELIEKDLVKNGELPEWWFLRRGIH